MRNKAKLISKKRGKREFRKIHWAAITCITPESKKRKMALAIFGIKRYRGLFF